MSIMIKGAEMPKGCAECPCILEEWMCGAKGLYVHNELINPFKERPNWCPLAEVVEVRHGHWVFCGVVDDIYGHGASCSVCGGYSEDNGYYCSCCGAKMDDALQRKTNPEAFKGGDDYE